MLIQQQVHVTALPGTGQQQRITQAEHTITSPPMQADVKTPLHYTLPSPAEPMLIQQQVHVTALPGTGQQQRITQAALTITSPPMQADVKTLLHCILR